MLLRHGTTRQRANSIVTNGPDPRYREPHDVRRAVDDGFSCCVGTGSFPCGTPEDYARAKAGLYPNQGGPVILELDVPDQIVKLAETPWLPLSGGVVQFDVGMGIEELLQSWDNIPKTVIPLEAP